MIEALASYARHQFELSVRQEDGSSLRDHLEAVRARTGHTPAALVGPELPEGLAPLWRDFLHLHKRRGSDGFAPSPITDVHLDAWQRNRGVRLCDWQFDAIEAADDAFFAAQPKPKGKGS